jgi:hypothetical protein
MGRERREDARMKKTLPLAVALVVGLGSSAFADFQFASGAAEQQLQGATATLGAIGNTTGSSDGSLVTYTADGGGDVVILRFDYIGSRRSPALTFYGFTDGGSGVTITRLTWSTNTTLDGTDPAQTTFVDGNVPDASSIFSLQSETLTFNNGGFIPDTAYTSAFVEFTMPAGSTLTIDAVSNPEPGAIALFAFGALGLGGFAWKRRKNVAAKRAS